MRSVLLASSKGGTSKTTTTFLLGVAASLAGLKCLVIDADRPQPSLEGVMRLRDDADRAVDGPDFAKPDNVAAALKTPEARAYDIVLIDAPPRVTSEVRELLSVVDLTLCPVQPSALDVAAFAEIREAALKADATFAAFISRADARRAASRQYHAALKAAGITMGPTMHERTDIDLGLGAGLSPAEWAPDGKAAYEIAALLTFVRTHVGV